MFNVGENSMLSIKVDEAIKEWRLNLKRSNESEANSPVKHKITYNRVTRFT